MAGRAFNHSFDIPKETGVYPVYTVPDKGRLEVVIANVNPGVCAAIDSIIMGEVTVPAHKVDPKRVFVVGPNQKITVIAASSSTDRSLGIMGYLSADLNQCGDDSGLDFGTVQGAGNQHTVTFLDIDGNTYQEFVVGTGDSLAEPVAPDVPGYTFLSWSGNWINVIQDETITPLYQAVAPVVYTITFVDLNGVTTHEYLVEEGGSATPPTPPTVPGMEFVSWDGVYANVTADAIITPRYQAIGNENPDPGDMTGDRPLTLVMDTATTVNALNTVLTIKGQGFTGHIDWGDGTNVEYHTDAFNMSHFYSSVGTYEIKLVGTVNHFDSADQEEIYQLKEIKQWGTNMDVNYFGAIPTDVLTDPNTGLVLGRRGFAITAVDAPRVRNPFAFRAMFYGCIDFNDPIGFWDISACTALDYMFYNAAAFNQDISGWNVSAVESLNGTFMEAVAFNQPIGSWNVSNVSIFRNTFRNARAFDKPLDGWNTQSATNTSYMFYGTNFNQDISHFVTSLVTDMSYMFAHTNYFNSNINTWNVSNVLTMEGMFMNTSNFVNPLGNWDVSSVLDMDYMFKNAAAFNQNLRQWSVNQVGSFVEFRTPEVLSDENTPCLFLPDPSVCNGIIDGAVSLGGSVHYAADAGYVDNDRMTDPNVDLYNAPSYWAEQVVFTRSSTYGTMTPEVTHVSHLGERNFRVSFTRGMGRNTGPKYYAVAIYRHNDDPWEVTTMYGYRASNWAWLGSLPVDPGGDGSSYQEDHIFTIDVESFPEFKDDNKFAIAVVEMSATTLDPKPGDLFYFNFKTLSFG